MDRGLGSWKVRFRSLANVNSATAGRVEKFGASFVRHLPSYWRDVQLNEFGIGLSKNYYTSTTL
jgi:hypothetical protein